MEQLTRHPPGTRVVTDPLFATTELFTVNADSIAEPRSDDGTLSSTRSETHESNVWRTTPADVAGGVCVRIIRRRHRVPHHHRENDRSCGT
jgi:hypothetical protein